MKDPINECPRCGNSDFTFNRYVQQEMTGNFGDPDSIQLVDSKEMKSLRSKTVQCSNCGYRIQKDQTVGDQV